MQIFPFWLAFFQRPFWFSPITEGQQEDSDSAVSRTGEVKGNEAGKWQSSGRSAALMCPAAGGCAWSNPCCVCMGTGAREQVMGELGPTLAAGALLSLPCSQQGKTWPGLEGHLVEMQEKASPCPGSEVLLRSVPANTRHSSRFCCRSDGCVDPKREGVAGLVWAAHVPKMRACWFWSRAALGAEPSCVAEAL